MQNAPKSNPSDDLQRTRFTDMNEDCMLMVFYELCFGDLLNTAQINSQFSQMAAYVFKRKYSMHRISMCDNFGMTKTGPTHIERSAEIFLDDYETVVNTFKYFGASILRVDLIYSSFRHYRTDLIGELIANYSSESLREVKMSYCTANTLEFISKPLVNVNIVQFADDFHGFGNESLVISDLFPSVEFLYLDGHFTTTDYFNTSMPQLRHLLIRVAISTQYNAFNSYGKFESLIAKNKQIRSIALCNTPSAYIRMVNSLLPNLENITLWHFQLKKPVRFENVTTFKVHASDSSPRKLQFPKLQNIYIMFKPSLLDEWQFFLNEHKQLTKFHWKNVDDMDDAVFHQLTHVLTNLIEMAVQLTSGMISAGYIKEFLDTHRKLMEFHLILSNVSEREILRSELNVIQIGWNIENIRGGLSFRRK